MAISNLVAFFTVPGLTPVKPGLYLAVLFYYLGKNVFFFMPGLTG